MTHPARKRTGVLFVCLGNICRSPLAEGVFIHLARARSALHLFEVDSCGTGGWHVGERPDPRSIAVARRNGVDLPGVARRFDPGGSPLGAASGDPARFRNIIAMDADNLRQLLELGCSPERTRLLRSFDPALTGARGRELDVPDPYTGGEREFLAVYRMIVPACEGLLDALLAEAPAIDRPSSPA